MKFKSKPIKIEHQMQEDLNAGENSSSLGENASFDEAFESDSGKRRNVQNINYCKKIVVDMLNFHYDRALEVS